MMKRKTKRNPEIECQVKEIMDGRKKLKREKREVILNGDWENIIPMIAEEKNPDINLYRGQMEKAGITIDELRKIASCSQAKILRIKDSGALEISLRKSDHSAVVIISEDEYAHERLS